jgi:hypothetical protein
MRGLLLVALLNAVTPLVCAQRMVSVPPRFAPGYNRGAHPHAFFYPLAFSDSFYSGYLPSTGYPAASQPPVIILQTPAVPAPVPDRSPSPSEPLMIELRGDRYVKVSGEETSGAQMIDPMPDAASPPRRLSDPSVQSMVAPVSPLAVLVFRDGHREEVSDYTIAGGILYARSDYYTTGSWNKNIELSSLNIPETVQSNQSRGVPFHFPTAPNEVIVGP